MAPCPHARSLPPLPSLTGTAPHCRTTPALSGGVGAPYVRPGPDLQSAGPCS